MSKRIGTLVLGQLLCLDCTALVVDEEGEGVTPVCHIMGRPSCSICGNIMEEEEQVIDLDNNTPA